MVYLSRIYTRTGDKGTTALSTGERRPKHDLRINAFGTVDETNSFVGLARQTAPAEDPDLDAMLGRIQNDLFDLGADLATPEGPEPPKWEPLRVNAAQVARLESEIDTLNEQLEPLRSFTLPGGTPTATALHVCRTVSRRAERLMVELAAAEPGKVSTEALQYINRLSDFFFVASRHCNRLATGDVLWVPGANR